MDSTPTEESPYADFAYWQSALEHREAAPSSPWSEAECQDLLEFNQRVGGGEAVARNVNLLQDSRTLIVIAGQQAGIMLTPLYILYKALAAIRWSQRLSNLLGHPIIPAFWIASDDHDFDEISRVKYLAHDGTVREWQYQPPKSFAGHSAFDYPVEASAFDGLLTNIEQESLPTEFKDEILGFWRSNASSSGNLEDFFGRGLADLCSSYGLVLIPSRLAPIRHRSIPVILHEIESPLDSTQIVAKAGQSWLDLGSKPPIHRNGQEANFFLYRDGIRCKVQFDNDLFEVLQPVTGELIEKTDSESLKHELQNAPSHFSPNVITRPLVQDSALPVLAMIGGPGEAQYLSQLNDVYKSSGIYQSVVLRRPRILLVEPRIERLLAKRHVQHEVLQNQDEDALRDLLSQSEDNETVHRLLDFRADFAGQWGALKESMGEILQRPSVASAIAKTEESLRNALDRLEQRVRDELKQQDTAQQTQKVMNSLFPKNAIQERTLGPIAPFLINYGHKFVEYILQEMDLDESQLQVMMLSKISSKK